MKISSLWRTNDGRQALVLSFECYSQFLLCKALGLLNKVKRQCKICNLDYKTYIIIKCYITEKEVSDRLLCWTSRLSQYCYIRAVRIDLVTVFFVGKINDPLHIVIERNLTSG